MRLVDNYLTRDPLITEARRRWEWGIKNKINPARRKADMRAMGIIEVKAWCLTLPPEAEWKCLICETPHVTAIPGWHDLADQSLRWGSACKECTIQVSLRLVTEFP